MAGLYFPHDLTARNDPKIIKLLKRFGMEGFGIYWALLELLGSNSEHRIPAEYEDIAWEFRCDAEKIRAVVCEFGLFEFTDAGEFYSERLSEHFANVNEIRDKRSKAGRISATKRKSVSTHVDDSFNTCSTHVENVKEERKERTKEKKEEQEKQEKQEKEKKQEKAVAEATDARARAREEAAAAEAELFLNTETYSEIVTELANETALKFGQTMAMPHQRRKMQELLNAIHIRGQDTPGLVREALQKLDKAEAITRGRMKFGIDQFLNPDLFLKLLHGNYDDCRKRDKKTTPDLGVSFSELAKKGLYDHD